MYNLSEEKKQELINEYLTTHIPVFQLCDKYGLKLNDFYILKGKENINRGRPIKFEKRNRKGGKFERKECNENFFEKLNNEKSAYWAGFILGDGCLSNDVLYLSLSAKDLNHLEKFQKDIESNYKLSISKGFCSLSNTETEKCTVSITNKKLANDLTKNEVTKNKSKHCVIPKSIPNELRYHFMRGLFDADGSFYINKMNNSACFSVVSSVESFLEEYQQILMKECDLNKTKIRDVHKNGKCYEFAYDGNLQVRRIMDYLYKDATIYLERKFNKFQEFYKSYDTINF